MYLGGFLNQAESGGKGTAEFAAYLNQQKALTTSMKL